MKVLITGGAGFIGSHLASTFVERGDCVTVFDKYAAIHEIRSKCLVGDLEDAEAVTSAVRGNDLVVHAGGLLGTHETVPRACETCRTNVIGSLNVIEAVSRYGNRLINISKPNVWLNPYSITKDCVEKFCFMFINEFDANVVVVKLYNAYGPRQRYSGVRKALPTWIVSALQGKPIEIYGSGTATMDLVHTLDVCRGIVLLAEKFSECQIRKSPDIAENVFSSFPNFNEQVLELGSGTEISVNEVVRVLQSEMGGAFSVLHLPMRPGEIDGTALRADISRLGGLTGFRPTVGLQQGLKETIAYYRSRLPEILQGESML